MSLVSLGLPSLAGFTSAVHLHDTGAVETQTNAMAEREIATQRKLARAKRTMLAYLTRANNNAAVGPKAWKPIPPLGPVRVVSEMFTSLQIVGSCEDSQPAGVEA